MAMVWVVKDMPTFKLISFENTIYTSVPVNASQSVYQVMSSKLGDEKNAQ